MTPSELIMRFPEIPAELHGEPVLAAFAEAMGPLLKQAVKPSPCSTQHDATNHYYLKLIGPMAILGYGLSTKEKVIGQLQEFIDKQLSHWLFLSLQQPFVEPRRRLRSQEDYIQT